MARKRMIDPEFWLDEQMAMLSPYARLLYIGIWGICDDNYATLPNKPEWIKVQIFPYNNDIDIRELLNELSSSGRIVLFNGEDENEYYFVKNFFKYQKVDRPSAPKYAPYKETRRVLEDSSTSTRPEVKLNKVKLSKVKLSKSGDSRPEKNSIGEILQKHTIGSKPKSKGISKEWQEKAFRYAEALNITLQSKDKGRWLKVFKQASEGRNSRNIDKAYAYLSDYPKPLTGEQKMLMFFKFYETGGKF